MEENTPGEYPEDAASSSSSGSTAGRLFIGPQGLRPFWGLLIYLAILSPAALYLIVSHMARVHQAPDSATVTQQISLFDSTLAEWLQFGFIFFAAWIMSRLESRSVLDYGLQASRSITRWLTQGALWGLLFMSLLITLLWSTHHLVFTAVLLHPLPAFGYGLAWAVGFIGVALFEEFLFRGYLQSNLTRCFSGLIRWLSPGSRFADTAGFWIAAVLISFGFGLVHKSNSGESPIGLLCAGCAGLLFAFSLWRTGSLWWAIGLHITWDWAQSFLYGVADSGAVSQGRLLDSHPTGSILMSGGVTGPEGSLFVLPVMLLIVLVIALTLRRDRISSTALPWVAAQRTNAGSTLA